jgi:hypothetical protein
LFGFVTIGASINPMFVAYDHAAIVTASVGTGARKQKAAAVWSEREAACSILRVCSVLAA